MSILIKLWNKKFSIVRQASAQVFDIFCIAWNIGILNECVFIYRTYHCVKEVYNSQELSEIERQLWLPLSVHI